ncbi:type VI secretion system baseplate subunit TssK [Pseudoduganella violaceinigra]|uniref:type VI secretion system baseplate subunit TssK n=1 Tax=Pseudoduganella violaceinigra TaxID=246602 RepID=UPI0004075D8B|nr:type VI secretion system baseplate subunit TssK [Pseudoduganella violaceinigra]
MRSTSNDRVAIPTDGILWHDGLLLAPLHFEQLTQRHEELVAYHVRSGYQYAWGVRRLELQPGKLAQNIVAVAELEAVMPDGLLVRHGDENAPLQLVLGDATLDALRAPGARCNIYLAVPAEGKTAGRARLRSVERDDEELCRVQPNARLVAEADLAPGAEVNLPLLQLKFEKQQLQLEGFLPPLLDIDLAPLDGQRPLRSAAMALQRRLAETERQLAAVAAECGDRLRRLELREQLHCLNAGLPLLGATLMLDTATPLQLYMALAQVLGHLAILRNLAEPAPEVPPYLHRNPRKTFDPLFALIDARLDTIERRCSEVAFERSTQGFSLMLDSDMLRGWPTLHLSAGAAAVAEPVLLIGVRGLAPELAEQWMGAALAASSPYLDDVRERRVRGAARYRIDADGGLILLAAERDPLAPAPVAERRIDAEGLRTAGTVLFAIAPDPQLVRASQRLLLEAAGGAMPEEIVLLIAVERRP